MAESSSGRRRGATIHDVAARAGVSTATVSRVLASSRPVGAELAARVTEAAAALGYHPNIMARGLSRGSLRHLAVVMPGLINPYFYEIVDRLSAGAAAAGYRLLVADARGDPAAEAQAVAELRAQVDGVFLLSPRIDAAELRRLVSEGVDLVLVNRVEPSVETATVAVDNFGATMRLCGHLLGLGHRRIAYLGGPEAAWQEQERWRALQAARDLGMEVSRVAGDGLAETAADAVAELLASGPTAIVCFNDLAAIGVLGRLADLGIRVPEDVSVAGFDDIPIARHLRPALTTVTSPTALVGERAWELMRDRLAGSPTTRIETLPAEVVVRATTAAPGGPARA